MRRSIFRRYVPILALTAFALGGAACDSGDTTPDPDPTEPTPTITETFAGSLAVNGAVTFNFTTTAAGTVTATLRSVTPDSGVPLGVSLGTWNGIICQVVLTNDKATQGTTVTGSVSGAGSLCVRVFDSGQVTQVTGFEVVVVHP